MDRARRKAGQAAWRSVSTGMRGSAAAGARTKTTGRCSPVAPDVGFSFTPNQLVLHPATVYGYTYTCIYIYIIHKYIYLYIYIYLHLYICTYIYMNIHICSFHVCICITLYSFMHDYTYIRIYVFRCLQQCCCASLQRIAASVTLRLARTVAAVQQHQRTVGARQQRQHANETPKQDSLF